jgi:hypothetical protein
MVYLRFSASTIACGACPLFHQATTTGTRCSDWAKLKGIQSWRPAQAELVQPRRLPDGLLEVRLQGETLDDLFLLEVTTYAERRVGKQLTDDLMLVYLQTFVRPHYDGAVRRPYSRSRRAAVALSRRCSAGGCGGDTNRTKTLAGRPSGDPKSTPNCERATDATGSATDG